MLDEKAVRAKVDDLEIRHQRLVDLLARMRVGSPVRAGFLETATILRSKRDALLYVLGELREI